MQAPKIYRIEISDLESIFGLSATPIKMDREKVYLLHHPQYPNNAQKKIAIKFIDKEGEGYDVYDYNEDIEYINIEGQYPTSIGPASLRNIEKIYPLIQRMISFTKKYHKF